MQLVSRTVGHVSGDTVTEFEEAILRSGGVLHRSRPRRALDRWIWKGIRTAPALLPTWMRWGPDSLAVVMGPGDMGKCVPRFLFARRRWVYVFDAFPPAHAQLEDAVRKLGIDVLFVSARQAADALRGKLRCAVHWVPEGVDPARYRFAPYPAKDIDVLHFGRRYDWYHDRIEGALASQRKTYLFERSRGAIVFPDRAAFLDGLARARISICVPSSVTHPERAGSVSTMTTRYLQSMASKCLVVGSAPPEMKELFPYDPVVAIDPERPADQIIDILRRYDEYVPLIERNHRTVLESHTWDARWAAVREILTGSREDRAAPG